MSAQPSGFRMRNLRMLAGLASLFLLPLAAAFWMYYGTGWRPIHRVNHGELIIPARPLPDAKLDPVPGNGTVTSDPFHRKWTLVYVGDGSCGDECRRALYVMRQTRLSLNNDMTRVERVFLATRHCCAQEFLAREHPGLRVYDASAPADAAFLRVFPAPAADSLFIVDPLGNLMMEFDVRHNPKGLLQDLKKLLTLSHIG